MAKMQVVLNNGVVLDVSYLEQLDIIHAIKQSVAIRKQDLMREGLDRDTFDYILRTVNRLESFLLMSGLDDNGPIDFPYYREKIKTGRRGSERKTYENY